MSHRPLVPLTPSDALLNALVFCASVELPNTRQGGALCTARTRNAQRGNPGYPFMSLVTSSFSPSRWEVIRVTIT